jgi:hypothetical protein
MLEEKAALVTRLSERMRTTGNVRSSARFESRAREATQQADLIRTALLSPADDAEERKAAAG